MFRLNRVCVEETVDIALKTDPFTHILPVYLRSFSASSVHVKCVHAEPFTHACSSVLGHLFSQAIHSLKNRSLDVLRLTLPLKSSSTVELFRALPQSRLKEFQFTTSDRPMVSMCSSLLWLLPNGVLQVTWQRLQREG